jgi:hypothetical protein
MCAIDIAVATARFQSPIHAQTLVGPVGEAQLKPLDWSFNQDWRPIPSQKRG